MKKNLSILIILYLTIISCKTQTNELNDFIPEGYVEFEKYFGDLNKDKQDDCVILIKKIDGNSVVINQFNEKVDRNRRGIIVLFKNENGYQLADRNYDCFSSENEDGGVYMPPELLIEFEKGNLRVHYGHGRYGFWRYTFRFQDSNFKLIGYDSSNNRGPLIEEETSINFLIKRKLVRKNTNQNAEGGDEIFKETWSNIEIANLINLSEIESFDELFMYDY
jgi:hypothetical protein